MQIGERKRELFELLVTRDSIRPTEYAALTDFHPARAAYSYLKRMHRWGYLYRRRDWKKRIVYKLAPGGARWLLWKRKNQTDRMPAL